MSSEGSHQVSPDKNDNPFGDEIDLSGIQPPKVTKKRQRGLSLRSQLLNRNLAKNATRPDPATQEPPIPDAIELTPMEEPYSSTTDVFRFEPEITMETTMSGSTDDASFQDTTIASGKRYPRNTRHRSPRMAKYMNKAKNLHHKLLGMQEIKPSENGRRIPLSITKDYTEPFVQHQKSNKKLLIDERTSKPYVDNYITSSRYNIYTFLPRQIYFQFSKLANSYFMVVAIMQMIPAWSTTGTYTTIIPLLVFMTISICREGYDDYKRHVQDKVENNKRVTVLQTDTPNKAFYENDKYSKSISSIAALRAHTDDLDSHLGSGSSSSGSSEHNNNSTLEMLSPGEEDTFVNTQALAAEGIAERKVEWKHLKVGDIVRMERDDWAPADIVLLSTLSESGEAYIETMALDGETNLKSKHPHAQLNKLCHRASGLKNARATLVTEDPNIDLYNFEATVEIPGRSELDMVSKFPLDSDNIIYRGSILRNTEAILGVVVFTGEETKIRMNAIKNPRIKAPKLQKAINMIVVFMVIVVCCLAAFSTMAQRLDLDRTSDVTWYLRGQDVGIAATLMGFIIMYNTLIPLSLYVTMEIIKVVQFVLLQWDLDMYHKPSNTAAEARTATILEELGQVSYIFSDKTGTLTNNVMIFRKFTVAGVSWLHDIDLLLKNDENEVSAGEALTTVTSNGLGGTKYTGRPSLASVPLSEPPAQIDELTGRPSAQFSMNSRATWASEANPKIKQNIHSTRELIGYIQTHPNTLFSKRAKFFLLSLALCHSCLPKRSKSDKSTEQEDDSLENNNDILNEVELEDIEVNVDTDDDDAEIDYQAASPDELALVVAARDMGFVVYDRNKDIIVLKTYPNGFEAPSVEEKYQVLDVIEFTSSRKRMSVIVKFPDGRICMFCKGADNIILDRLKNSEVARNKMKELSKETAERKNAEASAVLHKKSVEAARHSMSSLNGRPSLQLQRPSIQINPRMYSIDNYLEDTGDNEITDIVESSRRSFQMQQNKKYGVSQNDDGKLESIIPSDKLVINDEYVLERTLHHIEEFSTEGLRTLMYSYKWVDKNVYNDWSRVYREAKTALTHRNKRIEEAGELIESDFELLGATAIEDKLQGGVAEAIEKLRRAGIKMWMLTGDKRETAINIGYSCRLIKDYSTVVILSIEEGVDVLADKIRAADFEISAGSVAHSVIIIDGATLMEVEDDVTLMTPFIELGTKADSVICCRASPSQKANMVLSVRAMDKKKVTLAIGDGANDIAMIQSADIGIGITGKEGLQAARSSDYSIAQFRYLLKLLLVHGRYNYIRTSKFVVCTFYKELLFYLSQVIYQRQTMFTGSSLYESWSLSMFNTLFTSLPVLCIGMFEKDLRPSTLLAFPELYSKGRDSQSFNLTVFIYWMVMATCQSLLVSFLVVYVYGISALSDSTTYALSTLSFTSLVIVINTKCQILEMKNITKINFAGWFTSVGGWMVWCCLLPALYGPSPRKIFYVRSAFFNHFGRDYTWWAAVFILTCMPVMLDLFVQSIRREVLPTETDDFQILEKDSEFRKKCEIHSFEELQQSWTWPHESELLDAKVDSMDKKQRIFYKTKSFIRKGKTHQRKRTNTLPSLTELPPGSPSVVRKVSSKDSNYEVEILPSGKMIKKRIHKDGNTSTLGKLGNRFRNRSEDIMEEDDEDIEEILQERFRGLQES